MDSSPEDFLRSADGDQSGDQSGDAPAKATNYQSFSDPNTDDRNGREGRRPPASRFPPNPNFRGFSTSINSMFEDPQFERVDCCAMACCGILQSDRDRYLITGTRPPSCMRRFWTHVVVPLVIFLMAGYSAIMIRDTLLNFIFSCAFLFFCIGLMVSQCFKGQWKRLLVRRDLLWIKYQMLTTGNVPRGNPDDESLGSDNETQRAPEYYMGQTRSDLRLAHAPCSLYATDQLVSPLELAEFEGDNNQNTNVNICTKINRCYGHTCCGALCGMHLQFCGVCALAQEAREVQTLLHPSRTRIDYITLQPMLDYYPQIYRARHGILPNSGSIWQQLSTFSRSTVGYALFFLIILLVWSFVSGKVGHSFGPKDYVVFCSTLMQSFVLLIAVYWNHTQDISLDAVIKFFASGFFLSTTLAIFFEAVSGLTVRAIMMILIAISGVDVVASNGYSMPNGFASNPGMGHIWLMEAREYGSSAGYRDYLRAFGNDHPFVYTIYLFVSAYILAAFIEEMTKYFGFRMVDHPDFLTKDELEEAGDEYSPPPSAQGQERAENEAGEGTQQQASTSLDFVHQDRPMKSRGAAITVAMVVVSLGFACCENLVYIFVYGGSSLSVEISVLVIRSLFPIHPIAAALQSIGVCRRDLEGDKKTKLEKIITPAVILHGTYDFMLLWIDFIVERHGLFVSTDDDTSISVQSDSSGLISFVFSFIMLIAALIYYVKESRAQRLRFAAFDSDTSVDRSSLI